MLDGSWLMAQGSWLMAKGGQGRLMAHGQGPARTLGTQKHAGPGRTWGALLGPQGPGWSLAMSHEPPLASLGHEP